MILYGASGHAKVILDIIQSVKAEVSFIVDDNRDLKDFIGHKVLHDLSKEMENEEVMFSIGDNLIRKKLSSKVPNKICKALIHSSATVSDSVRIGEGTAVMANAVINPSVEIGGHCIINTGSILEHDCILADFVHISPSATVTGNVIIGEGAQVGAGAVVIPGINIGKWATIGAGSVIIDDVPDYAVVVGNPGRIVKFKKSRNE